MQPEADTGEIGSRVSPAEGADDSSGDANAEDGAALGLAGARPVIGDEMGRTPSSAECSVTCLIGVGDYYQDAVAKGEMNTIKFTLSRSSSSCADRAAAAGPAANLLGAAAAAASSSQPENVA